MALTWWSSPSWSVQFPFKCCWHWLSDLVTNFPSALTSSPQLSVWKSSSSPWTWLSPHCSEPSSSPLQTSDNSGFLKWFWKPALACCTLCGLIRGFGRLLSSQVYCQPSSWWEKVLNDIFCMLPDSSARDWSCFHSRSWACLPNSSPCLRTSSPGHQTSSSSRTRPLYCLYSDFLTSLLLSYLQSGSLILALSVSSPWVLNSTFISSCLQCPNWSAHQTHPYMESGSSWQMGTREGPWSRAPCRSGSHY